jgi:hypothetical protein
MAIATDTGRAPGIQRGRGNFLRAANDTPYVTHPTKRKKDGTPSLTPYASPSGLGKLIENDAALVKWTQRKALRGIALDPTLYAECGQLLQLDEDSEEHRQLADSIMARAKDLAEASIAADRGTHAHQLTEDADDGRSWEERAEAGELLGIDAAVQHELVVAWRAMLTDHGLEVLAVEASVVDDLWRTAGTLDRIVRLTRPLRFANTATGEVIVIPAGAVVILDVKTSKLAEKGDPFTYWRGYTVQIATYAQSVPYDTETGERGEWPWPIDQAHALIARPNLTEVLNGTAETIEWSLIHVDLVAGREHGGATVLAAKEWGKRSDLFATQIAPADVAPPTSQEQAPVAEEETPAAPSAPAPTPDPCDQLAAVATDPDEGGPIDDGLYAALGRRYMALPKDVRTAQYSRIVEQAIQHGVTFHLNGEGGRTLRRFEIARGLLVLAEHDNLDDETLRALLSADDLLGEVAQFPAVRVGHLVGSLDVDRATIFADRCYQLIGDQLVPAYDQAGRLSLHPAA